MNHTECGWLNGLVNCTNVRMTMPIYIIYHCIQVLIWKPWKLHRLTVTDNQIIKLQTHFSGLCWSRKSRLTTVLWKSENSKIKKLTTISVLSSIFSVSCSCTQRHIPSRISYLWGSQSPNKLTFTSRNSGRRDFLTQISGWLFPFTIINYNFVLASYKMLIYDLNKKNQGEIIFLQKQSAKKITSICFLKLSLIYFS